MCRGGTGPLTSLERPLLPSLDPGHQEVARLGSSLGSCGRYEAPGTTAGSQQWREPCAPCPPQDEGAHLWTLKRTCLSLRRSSGQVTHTRRKSSSVEAPGLLCCGPALHVVCSYGGRSQPKGNASRGAERCMPCPLGSASPCAVPPEVAKAQPSELPHCFSPSPLHLELPAQLKEAPKLTD